jgi:hypothetical protein
MVRNRAFRENIDLDKDGSCIRNGTAPFHRYASMPDISARVVFRIIRKIRSTTIAWRNR